MPASRPTLAASTMPERGYELSDLRARPFRRDDSERADWVLVMDQGHLRQAARLCPPQHAHKLRLLTDFC